MAGAEIIDFLEKKKAQGFTGCVKMVFEDGRLSLVMEANRLDFPMSKVFSQKAILGLVDIAEKRNFCGTLVFSFNHGEIDFYSYVRNYRGEELNALMGSESKRGKKK